MSRPRGAVGSGAAAVESAAVSVIARSCGAAAAALVGWDGSVVRFVRVIRVPECPRVSRECPGSPLDSF